MYYRDGRTIKKADTPEIAAAFEAAGYTPVTEEEAKEALEQKLATMQQIADMLSEMPPSHPLLRSINNSYYSDDNEE